MDAERGGKLMVIIRSVKKGEGWTLIPKIKSHVNLPDRKTKFNFNY